MNIRLVHMTRELCHIYMRDFVTDPVLCAPGQPYRPYQYSEETCNAYYDRHRKLGRIHLAVMLQGQPIGEVILKNIDYDAGHCTMGISLQCDLWKNRGFGTQAEILILDYAFTELGMRTVYADALKGNLRSRHVLHKAGFQEIGSDEDFVYYKCVNPKE